MIGITIGHIVIAWIVISCILFYLCWKSDSIGNSREGIMINVITFMMCMLISFVGALAIYCIGTLLWMLIQLLFGAEWMKFFNTVVF